MSGRVTTRAVGGHIKALRMLRNVPHRYRRLRRFTQAVTLLLLFMVPLSGLARFDAWGGDHRAGFQHVEAPIMALGWTLVAIVGFYWVTFMLNAFFGRVFCGFGCPIGQASRLADATQAARGSVAKRRAWLAQLGYALGLAAALVLWWVSPRVLWQGGVREVLATLGSWLGLAAVVVLHGRYWRWSFCRRVCPIGVYYSAVQTPRRFGIHYDASLCNDCAVCARACPVELDPRNLGAPIDDLGGISIDGFPGAHHCLTCGDCVRACEHALRRRPDGQVALTLAFGSEWVTSHEARPDPKLPKGPRDAATLAE
jgi:ferredoxin-type protein NapH